jgi:hypothetical protein
MQDLTRSQFSFTFNFLTFILELTWPHRICFTLY